MPAPPSLVSLAGTLADLAADLRRAECCLVVCDKGWTLPLYAALKERLRAAGVRCGYLDGRAPDGSTGDGGGTMLATVAMMRYVVRAETDGAVVYALPHLDVMTTTEGGWTSISREVVPLLYENPQTVWLGFQDPSLALPDVVTKVFTRRYVINEPYRSLETVPPASPRPLPEPQRAEEKTTESEQKAGDGYQEDVRVGLE
jgi:cell division protease FtsH